MSLDHAKLGGHSCSKGLGLSGGSATSSSSGFVGGQFGSSGSANSDWLSDSGADVSVHFESVPSGAAVYIDGQFLCSTTPCQKYVKEGSHEVRFNLQRYSDKLERVVIKKGSVVKGELEALFGHAKVTSSPSGVDIYSSNEKWGTTPFDKEVDPGIYTLEIKDPCYEPTGYRFQMKQGGKEEVSLSLTQKQSAVKVYPYVGEDAVDGSVYVDGKEVGSTAQAIPVPLCSKKIEVRTSEKELEW